MSNPDWLDEILTNFKLAVQGKGGYGYEETKYQITTHLKSEQLEARQKIYVPSLNEDTYKLLKGIYSRYGDQNYYSWNDMSNQTGLSIERCKELVPIFKKLGLLKFAKGLRTEEGEFYGSGYGVPHGNEETAVELAILRYETELQTQKNKVSKGVSDGTAN